jgi:hypothetical protein
VGPIANSPSLNPSSDPSGSVISVQLVASVLTTGVDAALADVITATADDSGAGRRDGAKTLVTLRVAKSQNLLEVSLRSS